MDYTILSSTVYENIRTLARHHKIIANVLGKGNPQSEHYNIAIEIRPHIYDIASILAKGSAVQDDHIRMAVQILPITRELAIIGADNERSTQLASRIQGPSRNESVCQFCSADDKKNILE